MKLILPFILIAALAAGCASKKNVYAVPFDDDDEVEVVTVEKRASETTTSEEPKVPTREEKVTMTHGDSMKQFNVIVGSFSNQDNAVRLRATLTGQGYTCIIMKNEMGMSRVSIAGFDQEAPARTELLRIRGSYPEFQDAWLLISR